MPHVYVIAHDALPERFVTRHLPYRFIVSGSMWGLVILTLYSVDADPLEMVILTLPLQRL